MNCELIDRIVIESDKITAPGILRGKMGVALALFSYASVSGDSKLLQMAEVLANESVELTSSCLDLSFSHGLTGIGSGIMYLMASDDSKNVDFILEDLDNLIQSIVSNPIYTPWINTISDVYFYKSLRSLFGSKRWHYSSTCHKNSDRRTEATNQIKRKINEIIHIPEAYLHNNLCPVFLDSGLSYFLWHNI